MTARARTIALTVAATLSAVVLAGCNTPSRYGMVSDPQTGFQYGAVVERNIVIDPIQFRNKKIKVSTRNTSGDVAFGMGQLADHLKASYAQKGYQPSDANDFGIRIDLNVLQSSQIRDDYAKEYAFLGAAAGGIAGYRAEVRDATTAGTAIGLVSGATLGAIIGSYNTVDTYIVIAEVAVAIVDTRTGVTERAVTFSGSPRLVERETELRPFRELLRTKIAVFAGGRNTAQFAITNEVRQRLASIVADII